MINILIPMAGQSQFFPEAEYPYPKPLVEVCGKTIIEHVINNFSDISEEKRFIFIVNSSDCKKYHIDNVLNLLTDEKCEIIKIDGETKGAACSALMAIEYIDNDSKLIIVNSDQVFDVNTNSLLDGFKECDAGVLVFDSIHPRWSYVSVGSENNILETSEKRPISNMAIAGFYFFREGSSFVSSVKSMIRKDAHVNGSYFIAPALNEMILKSKKLLAQRIDNDLYHTFYATNKIKEYERQREC